MKPLQPDELRDVPVFPLPRLVLFPGTRLPLHVFEPRYRDMLSDCVAQDRNVMAVAQLKEGWESDYEGRPPIYDVAGIGRIQNVKKNEDGTYDLELQAMARAHLTELPPEGKSYRRAQARLLRERAERVTSTDITGLLSLTTQIVQLVQQNEPQFELKTDVEEAPGALVDRIANQLVIDPHMRQDVLETLDVAERMRTVTSRLAQLHLALSAQRKGGLLH